MKHGCIRQAALNLAEKAVPHSGNNRDNAEKGESTIIVETKREREESIILFKEIKVFSD